MRSLQLAAVAACGAVLLGCPAPSVCEKVAKADLAPKTQACMSALPPPFLGADKATCGMKTAACTAKDVEAMDKALACFDRLPTCTVDAPNAWVALRDGCYGELDALSQPCVDGLMFVNPAKDAGVVPADAGPQPVVDGGEGVLLTVVGDEKDFALAWSTLQPASEVAQWVVVSRNAADEPLPEVVLPGSARTLLVRDAGVRLPDGGAERFTRRFFVVGFAADASVALGIPDGGLPDPDAGVFACTSNLQCLYDEVCTAGQCRRELCVPGGPMTCPQDYACDRPGVCLRQLGDAGTFDAGVLRRDAGMPTDRRYPMASAVVAANVGPVVPPPSQPLGSFTASRPDVVGIDSARVVTVAQQDSNVVAHVSSRRGKDFVAEEADTTVIVDTRGADPRLTYNPDSKLVFVCYSAGVGVRVRRSPDYGKTWLPDTLSVDPPLVDGGASFLIGGCDLAPGLNGGAVMVTVEQTNLVVRTLGADLQVTGTDVAFTGNDEADAGLGAIGSPQHPAIAALAGDPTVHVTFTAQRVADSTGRRDPEVYGVYRAPNVPFGATPPAAVGVPNPFLQDYSAVAIDPVTKRVIGAFTTTEQNSAGLPYTTVYLSLFNAQQKRWGTGVDLNVQYKNPLNVHPLLPAKRAEVIWDAFGPSLAILPDGRIFLGFFAGERAVPMVGNDYRAYVVQFDLTAPNPAVPVPGWYLPPALKLADVRVRDPRSGAGPVAPVGAFSADGQLSVFGVFSEGLGTTGDFDGRAHLVVRP